MGPNEFVSTFLAGTDANDISDAGLQEMFNHVKTYARNGDKPPFDTQGVGTTFALDMWNDLWSMPSDTDPKKIRQWYDSYRKEVTDRTNRAKAEITGSPFTGFGM
jgi:hypothetical protein